MRFLTSAAVAALIGVSGQAFADEQQDRQNEIVVTGERPGLNRATESGALGDHSILDTPFSVTVVDAEEIAERQPQTMAQLFVNDPAVFSFSSAGTVNWWGTQIRGLGVRNYYVDDAPLVLYWGGDYPLEAVETVQALKGATGFMFGFGAPGGAISYRTKRPTDAPLFATEFGFRGNSVLSAHVDAGGQLGDRAGYRLNVALEEGEEYNGAEVQRDLTSLAFDYELAPNLNFRATATHENYDLGGEPFHIYWFMPDGEPLPSVPDDYDNLNIDNSSYRTDTTTLATQLDWEFSQNWSLDLRYAYARKQHRANKTFIELLNALGDYNGYVYQFGELDISHFSQAMLQGEFSTGPIEHDVVFGAGYQLFDSNFGPDYVYSNDFNGNIFQAQPYRITGPMNLNTDGPFEERQTALFVSDTLHFGEHWQAIIGLRNTYYDLEDLDGDPLTSSGYSTTELTPTLALIYKPAANTSIYASYVESLEPGSIVSVPFSGPPYENFGEVLPATVSLQYEAGVKHEGERFSFTAAAFRIERVNQMDTFDSGGLRYLTQDGLTLYEGVEAAGEWRVTEDLTLGLGAVHLDASLEDVSDDNIAVQGNRPAETSEWQIVANAEYQVPSVSGLSLHGAVRYFGEAPVTDANTLIIPSYTLVSAGLNYRMNIGGHESVLAANINNLLNEQYWGLQNFGESINGSVSLTVNW